MKKKALIQILIIVIVVVGLIVAGNIIANKAAKENLENNTEETATETTTDEAATADEETTDEAEVDEDDFYSSDKVEIISGEGKLPTDTEGEYYIYVFSRTCSHCQNVKEYITEYAYDKVDEGIPFYLVESDSVENSNENYFIVDDINETYNVEVTGTPTILHVDSDGNAEKLNYGDELAPYGFTY